MTRTAIITGASRGIGLAVATTLAQHGFGLTITGRDVERLESARADLEQAGSPRVVTCAGDLADEAHSAQIVSAHREAFTTADLLVLNAGVGTAGTVGDYPMRRFDKTVAVNLRSPFLLVQESLPLLRAAAEASPATGARIVAMSSITGVFAESGLAVYGLTKAALISLVETINAEESGSGVSATAFAPGYVDTDMSNWTKESIPAESMIPAEDLARMVHTLTDLSARSVIPQLIVSRAGTSGFQP